MNHVVDLETVVAETGIMGPAADRLREPPTVCELDSTCVASITEVLFGAAQNSRDYFQDSDSSALATLMGLLCIVSGTQPAVSERLRVKSSQRCSHAIPDAGHYHAAIARIGDVVKNTGKSWGIQLGIDRPDDGRHYMIQVLTAYGARTWLHPTLTREPEFHQNACFPGAFRFLAEAVLKSKLGRPQPIDFPMLESHGIVTEGSSRHWADLYNAFTAVLSK